MMHDPYNRRARARGALSNHAGRYEACGRERTEDGWEVQPEERLVTRVRLEKTGRIISYNKSPDLPFDRSINPYRGCEHGCVYCFARPSHAWLGMSPGLDFETRLLARPDAAMRLREELGARSYRVATLAIGTNTDPYQPVEREHEITRSCLKVLAEAQHPVAIVTKGTLIERDIDILQEMARDSLVRVGISVTTLDAQMCRKMEPRAPSPATRLRTIERLADAGIEVRVMASPIVPGLTDPELEAILQAGAAAGARQASWIMLRLPLEVSQLWQEWLATHYPGRANRVMSKLRDMHGGKDYASDWHHRMRGHGPYAELLQARFVLACRKYGLAQRAAPLRCDLFRAPAADPRQMQLF